MIGKIGSEVNIFVVFIFIIEIFNRAEAQALNLEPIWWLSHFITDEKCDLI